MKRDFESLVFVSKAAMKILIMNERLTLPFEIALPLGIRDDESTSASFDVLDDSIPIVEGVPSNTFRWLEELS